MDYQVPVTCEQLGEWYSRLQGLAAAHHGQATGKHLQRIADEVHAKVPAEWWSTQPEPIRG